jgi:hypothetical protein
VAFPSVEQMRPRTRHFVALPVVLEAFSNSFNDMNVLMQHTGKKQWFGPREDLAVEHNKNLFILGVDATRVNRYELSAAFKFLEYVTKAVRLQATRAVILYHCDPERFVL